MLFMSWYCGNRCYCFVAAGGADAVGAAAGTAAVDRNGTKAPARLMELTITVRLRMNTPGLYRRESGTKGRNLAIGSPSPAMKRTQ